MKGTTPVSFRGTGGNKLMANKLKITLIKSPTGRKQNQMDTVRALGLTKIRSERVHNDAPHIRGMIFTVKHLVSVEEV